MIQSTKYVNYHGSTQSYTQGRYSRVIIEQAPTKHKLTGFSDSFSEGSPFYPTQDKGFKKKKS